MHGDYTRMTFRPSKDPAGVLMQQGRVTLDADWNELVELVDRRFRAETVDAIGRCYVSKETPDAFAITLGGGTLLIGRGRAYVHGLLAENHGGDPAAGTPPPYDAVLGEVHGTDTVAYEHQRYFPDAATVAPLPTTGTYVVYLDVWQREVTYLQDPDLVEKAIAVDTATRLQTAWQVRLLEAPDGTTCSSSLPAWDALTAPSAGRLTTNAVGVPASTDPCTVPAAGGYRGTENRLYRIEVHNGGPLGTATFKWSRDDASIGGHVEAIDTATRKKVTLDRLGRDGTRRIRVDSWVEVTDDVRELSGQPGELRKVAAVDDVTETITLAAALPPGAFDPTNADRHTRVVRWDQSGVDVDAANGVVAVPAAAGMAILLEDGVQISFDADPAGDDLHVGDYWVFAARTADASVEELVEEPPRGIKHHFCRLAVVTFPSIVVDCRTPPAQEDHGCDCTVCVTPESHASGTLTIYQAVAAVAPVGGKICLQPGVYHLDEPVRITGARSLELQGKGWATVLVPNDARNPAIIVQNSLGVTIDSLAVVTSTPSRQGAVATGIAIALQNTIGTIIERCVLAQLTTLTTDTTVSSDTAGGTGAAAAAGLFAAIGPAAGGAPLIALDGIVAETLIDENALAGTIGIGPLFADQSASLAERRSMDVGSVEPEVSSLTETAFASRAYLISFDLAVENNLFVCSLGAVALEGLSMQLGETRIAHNSVLGCIRAGITSLGLLGPLGRIDVLDNLLRVMGTGIAVGTDDTRVADNDVASLLTTRTSTGGIAEITGAAAFVAFSLAAGIVLAPSLRPAAIDRCIVSGNRLVRVLGDGIAIRAQVASATLAHNVLQAIGGSGIAMEDTTAVLLTVESNQLLDVAVLPVAEGQTAAGILLTSTQNAAVVSNTIAGVAATTESSEVRRGIAVRGCGTARITANDVSGVAPEGAFLGQAVGIAVEAAWQQADVTDNVVRRGTDETDDLRSSWIGIMVAGGAAAPAGTKLVVNALNALIAAEGLLLFSKTHGKIVRLPRGRGTAGIHGNMVDAYGGTPAVLVETPGSCTFSDNRCFLVGPPVEPVAQLFAGALVANANYLEGPERAPSLVIQLSTAAAYTVLANVTSGPIMVGSGPLPAPWNQLNVS